MKIAVIGAGSWGTAVSWLLGGKGIDVNLWSREAEIAEGIASGAHNPIYLTDIALPPTVVASTDFETVLAGVQAAVVVTPSHGVRQTASAMAPYVRDDLPVINLSKGIEAGTHMRMTQVLEDVLGGRGRLAALSGPNHAEEVGKGIPSATVIAAHDEAIGTFFQELFMAPAFRVYTNPDVVGVELGGASKNVVAVAAGMSDGLGYGDNTKASLMTRGLAEMSRLGVALGAKALTYMGLSGMGDLIATCTSQHSRNRGLGEMLARGGSVESYAASTHMVAEGAMSATTVDDLGASVGIELPITHVTRGIIAGEVPISAAREILMVRALKDEMHGLGLVPDDAQS